jgi:hypothetical protein
VSREVERLRQVLAYDRESGVFTWLVDRTMPTGGIVLPSRIGTVAGCINGGRVSICIFGRQNLAHRLAWLYVYGSWPRMPLDHIDGDQTNNRISNLRMATKSQNGQNVKKARRNSKSGVLGVYWNKRFSKWIAELTLDGKRVHCSYHRLIDDAAAAYAKAKSEFHPFSTG